MTAEAKIDDGATELVLRPDHKWEEGLLERIRDEGRHVPGQRGGAKADFAGGEQQKTENIMSDEPNSAVVPKAAHSPPVGRSGICFQTMDELFRFAKAVSMSGLAPKGLEKPEAIFVAVQLGLELGLSPMAALQNIGVINGRPGIYGDAALALVRASGLLEQYTEKPVGKEGADEFGYYIKSLRKGMTEPTETTFTIKDAKTAQLWGKSGPWTQYPKRMLMWRARGFNLRDNFGDVLKGLKTTEELSDYASIEIESERQPKAVLDKPAPKAIEQPKVEPKKEEPKPAVAAAPEAPKEEATKPEPKPAENPPGPLHSLRSKMVDSGISELEFFRWAHKVDDRTYRLPLAMMSLEDLDCENGDALENFDRAWFLIQPQILKERKAEKKDGLLV